MKSNYEEKRASQLENATVKAIKLAKMSDSAHMRARAIGDMIPMGQPILVGHHSEKRHRGDIAKIDNAMRQSIALGNKAKHYAEKAERLANDSGVISSDDPQALEKLQAKLEALEWQRDQYKLINVAYRAFAKKGLPALEAFEALTDKSKIAIANWTPQYSFDKAPIAAYMLSNLGSTIKTVKDRIERLEKLASVKDTETVINGVRLVGAASENRIQMFFDGKPSPEIIAMLKGRGFRWAPTVGAWMRHYSNGAIYDAKEIASKVIV